MSKQIKHLLYALPLLMAAGCDTTEEAFQVGTVPQEENFLNVDKALLSYTPEGGTQEFQITSIASWRITVSGNNHNQFSVEPLEGRGNATIKVTSKANPAQNSYSGELQISPLNFEMDPVKVTLTQSNTTFSVDTYPSTEVTPEEGGTLVMTAYASVKWKLEVQSHDAEGNIGDPNWLTITPSMEGEGQQSNTPIDFRFVWSPNYTNDERTIRLCLVPDVDFTIEGLPHAFTLTQQAGTYPANVRNVLVNLDIVKANVSLEYNSRSPMKDCGIYVYKVDANGEGTLVDTCRPVAAGGQYEKNGPYNFDLPELIEDTNYRIIPFAVNEVGTSTGDPVEFKTGIKPENMMYDGVAIVNGVNGVTIESSASHEDQSASARFSAVITSDVAPINNKIASAVLSVNGKQINGTATAIENGSWLYNFNATGLTPNKSYDYTITVTSADLPREQGQMRNKTAVVNGSFKTPGLTPGDNDNDKPNFGE